MRVFFLPNLARESVEKNKCYWSIYYFTLCMPPHPVTEIGTVLQSKCQHAHLHPVGTCWILLEASELNPNTPSQHPSQYGKDKVNLGYMTRPTWATWQDPGRKKISSKKQVNQQQFKSHAQPDKCQYLPWGGDRGRGTSQRRNGYHKRNSLFSMFVWAGPKPLSP